MGSEQPEQACGCTCKCSCASACKRSEETFEGPYREVIGGRFWIANTIRSDVSNAVRDVASQAHDPSIQHWNTILRIAQY